MAQKNGVRSPVCSNCEDFWFGVYMTKSVDGAPALCMRCTRAKVPKQCGAANNMTFFGNRFPPPAGVQLPGGAEHLAFVRNGPLSKVRFTAHLFRLPTRKIKPGTGRNGQYAIRGQAISFLDSRT